MHMPFQTQTVGLNWAAGVLTRLPRHRLGCISCCLCLRWESPGVKSSHTTATINNLQVLEPCIWQHGFSGMGGSWRDSLSLSFKGKAQVLLRCSCVALPEQPQHRAALPLVPCAYLNQLCPRSHLFHLLRTRTHAPRACPGSGWSNHLHMIPAETSRAAWVEVTPPSVHTWARLCPGLATTCRASDEDVGGLQHSKDEEQILESCSSCLSHLAE